MSETTNEHDPNIMPREPGNPEPEDELSPEDAEVQRLESLGVSDSNPESLNTMRMLCADRDRQLAHWIRLNNRLEAGKSGRANISTTILQMTADHQRKMVDMIDEAAAECVKDHPIWPWLQSVRGIGPVLAAQLLALFAGKNVLMFPLSGSLRG